MNQEYLKSAFEKEWYIQGTNAAPIFLSLAGWSGFQMEKEMGFGYSSFIFNYRNDYGEIRYLKDDLIRIWRIIKEEIKKDGSYLSKIQDRYAEKFAAYGEFFSLLDEQHLKGLDEDALISCFKKCAQAMTDSVGQAHIIEAVGIEIEAEFKEKLFQSLQEKAKFNYYAAELTNPSELSFLAEEENDLLAIKKSSGQKDVVLQNHAEKYHWIQNSYAGPINLDVEFFSNKMNSLPDEFHSIKEDKKALIKELDLDGQIQEMIEIIDFTTNWQDKRKANILRAISYLGAVVSELGRRTGIKSELLHYLGAADIKKIKKLADIKILENELIKRRSGVFFVCENAHEHLITGKEYERIIQEESLDGKHAERELRGSIANMGTAIGRVVICTNIESIAKVQVGDILVASMTRPEFMPAMKKAAAIVTDEGGITCHAAIVARELGIPAVIGTKIATKVLKDGMLVEVKANHGLVKIIQ